MFVNRADGRSGCDARSASLKTRTLTRHFIDIQRCIILFVALYEEEFDRVNLLIGDFFEKFSKGNRSLKKRMDGMCLTLADGGSSQSLYVTVTSQAKVKSPEDVVLALAIAPGFGHVKDLVRKAGIHTFEAVYDARTARQNYVDFMDRILGFLKDDQPQ